MTTHPDTCPMREGDSRRRSLVQFFGGPLDGLDARCVTTDFGAVDCLKCMAAVLGLKLAKAVLEKRRERTNAMLAKCATEIDSRDTGTAGGGA